MDLLAKPADTIHPVEVGLRTEAAILSELVRRGYNVLTPFGFNHRYDLVLDVEGRFVRAQCKTGRLKKGSVIFPTRSIRTNTKGTHFRGYVGEIDVFLVYCLEIDGLYSVPIDEAPGNMMSLRIEPTQNKQHIGVRWASRYELPG